MAERLQSNLSVFQLRLEPKLSDCNRIGRLCRLGGHLRIAPLVKAPQRFDDTPSGVMNCDRHPVMSSHHTVAVFIFIYMEKGMNPFRRS